MQRRFFDDLQIALTSHVTATRRPTLTSRSRLSSVIRTIAALNCIMALVSRTGLLKCDGKNFKKLLQVRSPISSLPRRDLRQEIHGNSGGCYEQIIVCNLEFRANPFSESALIASGIPNEIIFIWNSIVEMAVAASIGIRFGRGTDTPKQKHTLMNSNGGCISSKSL